MLARGIVDGLLVSASARWRRAVVSAAVAVAAAMSGIAAAVVVGQCVGDRFGVGGRGIVAWFVVHVASGACCGRFGRSESAVLLVWEVPELERRTSGWGERSELPCSDGPKGALQWPIAVVVEGALCSAGVGLLVYGEFRLRGS